MPTAAIPNTMNPQQETPTPPTTPAGDVLAFPASVAQQTFWYLDSLQNDLSAFNVPLRFRLTGPLDVSLLERTINTLIARHETLRTHFAEEKGNLLQIVAPELVIRIPVIDISHMPADRMDEEADRLGSIEARRPFQLSKGPMIRAELVRMSADSHILHVTVHHALFDGMSMTILTRELAAVYQAYFDGDPCPLEPLDLQYGDFSVWQTGFLESAEMKRQLDYWKQRLSGMKELELPTDFPRPAVKSWKGDITSVLLPAELTERLHAIAAKHGATLFHLQLAAYMLLLHRYSGADDIAVGTPVTGRTRGELEPIIGVFINSLILRGDLSRNPSFESLLVQVRSTALEALENQEIPFECLVRELRPERDQSRNPMFQVNFNHHRSFAKPGTFGGVTLSPIPSRSPGTIFDLHFFMVERKEGWRASCDYSTDLFTRASADRMLGHYKHLLENIADRPEAPIEQFEILTPPENTLLWEWSGHARDFPRNATIGSLFLETADRFPDRIALECGDRTFTYRHLRDEATLLAHALLDSGIKPGDSIAISSRPGPEMIAGFLATLLAGACCVPIDPSYPADGFALLLDESGARQALVGAGCESAVPKSWTGRMTVLKPFGTTGSMAPLPDVAVTAEHPAFLLFTSGSTGRPKGVILPHRGTVRLVRNNDFISITSDDVFLQAAPVSFDASLLEIWGALLNGGRLILMPDGPSLDQIASSVRTKGVTTLWLTAGLFQLMVDEHLDSLKGLRHLLAGGDVLSPNHVRKALDGLPDTALINGYGPTENAMFTTCHRITVADLGKSSIPIGKPIANTTVHILDQLLRPVPIGIPGELCTGGDGLATGYLKSPGLTGEKFIAHPEFGRLYRTGDIARWSADGSIEFLGRRDHQVKVRGFRIELGEIETILADHPQVRQAKAAVRGNGAENKRILAWVVPENGGKPSMKELSSHLASRLPAFMLPDGIGVVDAFPLNANGKIQVNSLPDPGHRPASVQARPREAPIGATESHIAGIWMELLGIPEIDRHDDFFALGGHSLMALRMFSRINREFQKSLPLATLLEHPTIAGLAPLLEDADAPAVEDRPSGQPVAEDRCHIVTLAEGTSRPPLFCIHGGDGGALFYQKLASLMPAEIPFHAIESLELGKCAVVEQRSVEETAASYLQAILRVQSSGTFRIAGYSFGGVVAHEIACRLVGIGHDVGFLGLFDTHNPAAPVRSYGVRERIGIFWEANRDLSLPGRITALGHRIREGIQTHREVAKGQKDARLSGPAPAFTELRRIQVREENWRSMLAYRPGPFPGRITLFKTTHANDKFELPADYGWAALAQGGLDILSVTGGHLELFSPGHVEILATTLTHALKLSEHPPAR
jgi:amino acid adenylation domain-containing protein